MDDIVAMSDRVYRLILNVYPRAFLDEYKEGMAQTMRDQARDAWTERRVVGVFGLWLRVLVDTVRSALAEHVKQGWRPSPTVDGFGFGLTVAIGFPMALLSSTSRTWSAVWWAAQSVGLRTESQWLLHRVMAVGGFVLAGIGLSGLCKRVEFRSTISRTVTIGAVWLGVALGLLDLAGIYSPVSLIPVRQGLNAVPFVLLTLGLASIGVSAFRAKGFGVLSFIPLAVVVSLGWWLFVVMTPPVFWIEDVLYTSALLIHIALWFILGVVVWADPQEGTDSVPTG